MTGMRLPGAAGLSGCASGSDDFTMFLWEPSTSQKPIARMTGHLQLINQVRAYMVATFHHACVLQLASGKGLHPECGSPVHSIITQLVRISDISFRCPPNLSLCRGYLYGRVLLQGFRGMYHMVCPGLNRANPRTGAVLPRRAVARQRVL